MHIEAGKLQEHKNGAEELANRLRAQVSEKEREMETWRQACATAEAQLQTLKQQPQDSARVSQLTQELQQVQMESEQRIGVLQQQLVQQAHMMDEYKHHINELKQQVSSNEMAKQQMEIELHHLKQRLTTMTQQHQEAMQHAEHDLSSVREELRRHTERSVVPVEDVQHIIMQMLVYS